MKKSLFVKQMMLMGLVALPLVGVNVNAQNTNNFRVPEGSASFPFEGGTSTEMCDGFPLIPDTGWQACVFETEGDIDTFVLELKAKGCLRISDVFIDPDNIIATRLENGKTLTTSSFKGGELDPEGLKICQDAWESEYVKGEAGLMAGNHTIEMTPTDPNTGVFPAAYCIRFDTESPACRALKSEGLTTQKYTVVTNNGDDRADVYFSNGDIAAADVAKGVSVIFLDTK